MQSTKIINRDVTLGMVTQHGQGPTEASIEREQVWSLWQKLHFSLNARQTATKFQSKQKPKPGHRLVKLSPTRAEKRQCWRDQGGLILLQQFYLTSSLSVVHNILHTLLLFYTSSEGWCAPQGLEQARCLHLTGDLLLQKCMHPSSYCFGGMLLAGRDLQVKLLSTFFFHAPPQSVSPKT